MYFSIFQCLLWDIKYKPCLLHNDIGSVASEASDEHVCLVWCNADINLFVSLALPISETIQTQESVTEFNPLLGS